VTYSLCHEDGGGYAQIKDVLCPLETPHNTAFVSWAHHYKTPSARTPPLALPTLPIEYQYFKSYKMDISLGSFSSSSFIIL
jgi:hypothetical protein